MFWFFFSRMGLMSVHRDTPSSYYTVTLGIRKRKRTGLKKEPSQKFVRDSYFSPHGPGELLRLFAPSSFCRYSSLDSEISIIVTHICNVSDCRAQCTVLAGDHGYYAVPSYLHPD